MAKLQNKAQAAAAEPVVGVVEEPTRDTAALRVAVPTTTAKHAGRA